MVDDFMVAMDKIIASACFESVNGDRDRNTEATAKNESIIPVKSNGEGCSSLKKMKEILECRICQEEDDVHSMEAPCACNGTLKFAHRKCIQRWCNKKGNITCEICNHVFSPNYSVPASCGNTDVMSIDIRQAWHEPQLLVLAAAERQFLQSDYAVANTSSIACFRSIALILLVFLLLFQALLVTVDTGVVQDSSTLLNVSLLRFAGFLLPCYVMARSWYIVQNRRRQG